MRLLFVLLLLLVLTDDGARRGRHGNEAYQAGRYAEAAEAYRQGLLLTQNPAVRFGLQHNLGVALLQLGHVAEARAAFEAALRLAPSETERARAAYNAGNAAVADGDIGAALRYYRIALLADPTFEDARFNYEYLLRHQPPTPPPPNTGTSTLGNPSPQPETGAKDQGNPQASPEASLNVQQPSSAQSFEDPTGRLSPEMAARLLEALQQQEQAALRRAMQLPARPEAVEKDW